MTKCLRRFVHLDKGLLLDWLVHETRIYKSEQTWAWTTYFSGSAENIVTKATIKQWQALLNRCRKNSVLLHVCKDPGLLNIRSRMWFSDLVFRSFGRRDRSWALGCQTSVGILHLAWNGKNSTSRYHDERTWAVKFMQAVAIRDETGGLRKPKWILANSNEAMDLSNISAPPYYG